MILSPERLFSALKREVVDKNPEVFKINALSQITRCFGRDSAPAIIGGFGNKHTDANSYLAVGIPRQKIFIVNPEGQLRQEGSDEIWSYSKLNEMVEFMFPEVFNQNKYKIESFKGNE